MNVTPEYKKYIEDSRAAGMTDIQIRSALLQAGWTDVQVSDLFNSFNHINNPAPVVPPALQKPVLEKPELEKREPTSAHEKPFIAQSPASTQQIVTKHADTHMELEKRPEITPQVEPQQLRPHISHPTYEAPVRSEAASVSVAAGNGIASYQTGSQLNTPLRSESLISENRFASSVPPSEQPSPRMANPSVAPANSPYNMQPNTASGPSAVITEMKPGNKGESSGIKKVFFSILIVAFLLGSAAYAYVEYVDPFVIESDEVTLAKATTNLIEFKGARAFDSSFNVDYKSQPAVSFGVDTVVDNSSAEDMAVSLRIYDIKINPELEEVQAFLDEEMIRQIELFDLRFIALDNYGYVYPGIITSFIPIVEGLEELLFEKWVRIDLGEAETSAEEFAGIDTQDVELPPYTIIESKTVDTNKHLTLEFDVNTFKENLIADSNATIIGQNQVLPPLVVKLIINADREITKIELVSEDAQNEISSFMTVDIRVLEAGDAIIAPTADEIVDSQVIMDMINRAFSGEDMELDEESEEPSL